MSEEAKPPGRGRKWALFMKEKPHVTVMRVTGLDPEDPLVPQILECMALELEKIAFRYEVRSNLSSSTNVAYTLNERADEVRNSRFGES